MKPYGKGKARMYLLLCEHCDTEYTSKASHFKGGNSNSCKVCRNKQDVLTSEEKRLRRIYNGMVSRCYNEHSVSYDSYGGKGITICKEWQTQQVFIDWALSHGYTNELTIDRKNHKSSYSPINCRWATPKQQANENRRVPTSKLGHLYIQYTDKVKLNRYRVVIKGVSLKGYPTLEEAISVRNNYIEANGGTKRDLDRRYAS